MTVADSAVIELSAEADQLKDTLQKEAKEKKLMEDAMGELRVQIFTIEKTKKDRDLPLVKQ
eukprot:2824190-Pyramimonas_sp.AAC.1